jgi:hypothetical protein
MSNPIYDALAGNNMGMAGNPINILQQFQNFRNTMQGKNPNEEIQRMLRSGQISQQQLNQAQQMAMQMQNMLRGFIR